MVRLIQNLALFVCLFVSTAARAEFLVMFSDDHYPPVSYAHKGQPAGLMPLLLTRISRITGDTYEVHTLPWSRAYLSALNGRGGIAGLSWNEGRSTLFDYSQPVYTDSLHVVVPRNRNVVFEKLEDLKGKTLGGVWGASYGNRVDRAITSGLFSVERDGDECSRLLKVLAGRIDGAIIGNGAVGYQFVINSRVELRRDQDKLLWLSQPLEQDILHVGFARSMQKKEAVARINSALTQLKASGELRVLIDQAITQAGQASFP